VSRRVVYAFGVLCCFGPLAACTTAQLTQAAEVCQIVQADGPVFIALANANGVPVSASGKAATAIAADCAAVGAVAASLPAGVTPKTVTLPAPAS
jgi:hypothetical protein